MKDPAMDNNMYNKVKLLHELGCLVWFIGKHARKDAEQAGEQECVNQYQELAEDLNRHIDALKDLLCRCK